MTWRPIWTVLLALTGSLEAQAQIGQADNAKNLPKSEEEAIRILHQGRDSYQASLLQLRSYYLKVGNEAKAKEVETELVQYHRILKPPYNPKVGDVPAKTLSNKLENKPEANKLLMQAMFYKDRGFGTDYIDNQRRAELLLQEILQNYSSSDKRGLVAYQLGDLYEGRSYKQYERAAMYFERAFQWDPTGMNEARLRAAQIYDRQLEQPTKAVALYKSVMDHDTDPARREEATRRIAALGGR